jgi:hypothetical protein
MFPDSLGVDEILRVALDEEPDEMRRDVFDLTTARVCITCNANPRESRPPRTIGVRSGCGRIAFVSVLIIRSHEFCESPNKAFGRHTPASPRDAVCSARRYIRRPLQLRELHGCVQSSVASHEGTFQRSYSDSFDLTRATKIRFSRTFALRLVDFFDRTRDRDLVPQQHAASFRARSPSMRTYPLNSPQAAARIVALTLLADGHACLSEERILDKLDIDRELGLAPAEFARIVQALCEDSSVANASLTLVAGRVDWAMLDTLLAEVDDPVLRRKTIRLCLAVAAADDFLADGEIAILAAVLNAWTPQPHANLSQRNAASGAQRRAAATTRDAST